MKLKLRRDPTSSTSDLYEFKCFCLTNFDLEEFLLFVCNFNMTLAASGTLKADTKFQYLRATVRRELLRHFGPLSSGMESMETLNVDYVIRGLAQYFSTVNSLSKQKRAMRRGIKNRPV